MTKQQALKAVQKLWGPRAAVKMEPKGARVGEHGEYVKAHLVINTKGDPKEGRYLCQRCSATVVEGSDVVERRVYHCAGGWQASYSIGVVADFGFAAFHVRAEAESFEAALAKWTPKKEVA